MARMAAAEESECIRSQEDPDSPGEPNASPITRHKYVVKPQEVTEAFETINTLRYSQPAHLQGI